ncbi:hypothetical protein DC030_15370, partial [Enterococcus faecalis]
QALRQVINGQVAHLEHAPQKIGQATKVLPIVVADNTGRESGRPLRLIPGKQEHLRLVDAAQDGMKAIQPFQRAEGGRVAEGVQAGVGGDEGARVQRVGKDGE